MIAMIDTARILTWLGNLQKNIGDATSALDGCAFRSDEWLRPEGGGGRTMILENGQIFERAGIAFSHVKGKAMPASATQHRPELAGRAFEAMGVSMVMHPENPYCPTAHMNVRCFIATKEGAEPVWWFGGGMDLTPYYPVEDDVMHFHRTCKDALAPFGADVHGRYKRWCDEYFFLKHRNEARGVGGIFFDDLNEGGAGGETPFERCFGLTRAVGESFVKAYLPIIERRRANPFGERERDFQAVRRGRYVEFNLVWDRGTLFGLQSGGRTESILLSMPPLVKWRYDWTPESGTPEAVLHEKFLPPRDWA